LLLALLSLILIAAECIYFLSCNLTSSLVEKRECNTAESCRARR
jgi:hypothetical protein